jgi:hypothetical protein
LDLKFIGLESIKYPNPPLDFLLRKIAKSNANTPL